MVFLGCFVQVDKTNGVYFYNFCIHLIQLPTFVISGKTEAGTAGEQPVRDTPDDRRKCHFKGTTLSGSFEIFRGPYAFKNSPINFFLRSTDNPLWFLSLFFRSAKCPSMALVVLGIFKSI